MNLALNRIALILMILNVSTFVGYSQTGVGTRNPLGALHIDGQMDNPLFGPPSDSQEVNDVIITASKGFIGVGTVFPQVKLDLRSTGLQNAIGIGTTTMAASAAETGALRYYHSPGGNNPPHQLQTSDGVVWHNTLVSKEKTVVVARIMTGGQLFPANQRTNVLNWTKVADPDNVFAASTGVFTAPRTGVYSFYITYNFMVDRVSANSRIEVNMMGGNNFNTILSYSTRSYGQNTLWVQMGGAAIATLQLNQGEQVRPALLNATSYPRWLRVANDPSHVDFGFNNITILEH